MTEIMLPPELSLADINAAIDHEPRILDLRLAERLDFARPRAIRQIIERNRAELEAYGPLVAVEENSRHGGAKAPHGGAKAPHGGAKAPHGVALSRRGTPGRVYWLNEAQTLLVCMFSKTSKAAAIRREVIQVFMTWRRGEAPVHPAADPRRQNQSWALMVRLNKTSDPEQRQFLYTMLEVTAQAMGLTAPPITSMGRDAPQQPDILVPFWARIDALLAEKAKIDHSRNPNLLALNLIDLRERYGMAIDADLRQALKLSLSPRFIALRAVCSTLTGKTVKCWLFARSGMGERA